MYIPWPILHKLKLKMNLELDLESFEDEVDIFLNTRNWRRYFQTDFERFLIKKLNI